MTPDILFEVYKTSIREAKEKGLKPSDVIEINLPDVDGVYQTRLGSVIVEMGTYTSTQTTVNWMAEPKRRHTTMVYTRPQVTLTALWIAGRGGSHQTREIKLDEDGKGSLQIGSNKMLVVKLKERPVIKFKTTTSGL